MFLLWEMEDFLYGDGRFRWRKSFLCYDLSLDSCGLAGLFCWCCTVVHFICNCIISISIASLAITPIASMIAFHDKMNGIKEIAMLLAIWGFASHILYNYLDDSKAR